VDRRGVRVTVSSDVDFAALEAQWRDLERRADPSFFQSWTWTGCLAAERFADPVLVEAHEDGRTVALALFNRRGETLYLGESGDPALDCVYIEFNGVLTESGREAVLGTACLRAAHALAGVQRLVLSGIDAKTMFSAGEIGPVLTNISHVTHFVDISGSSGDFLDRRSANTRQQLRRSDRFYAGRGEIATNRAETPERAHEFLDDLGALHQVSWTSRGEPGAFAKPFFARFHHALIDRGLPRGEIDLLRIEAGPQTVGLLYNFRFRGASLAYQSGFDYADVARQAKPGLTCHHQAIRFAAARGASRYDFLAGDDRYKRSLSDRTEALYWVETSVWYSPRLLSRRLLGLFRS
jgi:CelD/BcsL family acetyltransferase involved in cellulose biosynthesis